MGLMIEKSWMDGGFKLVLDLLRYMVEAGTVWQLGESAWFRRSFHCNSYGSWFHVSKSSGKSHGSGRKMIVYHIWKFEIHFIMLVFYRRHDLHEIIKFHSLLCLTCPRFPVTQSTAPSSLLCSLQFLIHLLTWQDWRKPPRTFSIVWKYDVM